MRRVGILLACLIFISCRSLTSPTNLDFNADKPHHRPDGFVNRYAERSDKPGLWRWQFERLRDGLPKPPESPVKGISPNLELINSAGSAPRVTWIGHSTLLIQIDGLNLLTDPHWGNRASPFSFIGPKRHQAPGIPFDRLPKIDAVMISHNHYDHLDRETVQNLMDTNPKIQFFVPLGVQYWFAKEIQGARLSGPDQNVIPLDWDDYASIRGKTDKVNLHLLAVQHWSARSLGDRYETLWGSWAVIHPQFRFWFSGDLGYSQDTKDVGEKMGGFDLAAIAIGAYEPRWFMKESHLDPSEAIQVMGDIKAKSAIGIHWGTFDGLSDDSLDQAPKDLEIAKKAYPRPIDFTVLQHGQTWVNQK